ncbi:MAG: M28 family peptidase [Gemmatimonadaceae bacterium]
MRNRPFAALAAVLTSTAVAGTLLSCSNMRSGARASAAAQADSVRIRRDIQYLASDALEGRGTGTAGNDSAAAFAARRYDALGLRAVSPGYLQPFTARSAMSAHSGGPSEARTQNVVALLRGTDPSLRGQTIVIGAHIDHLGRSTMGALDPEAADAIRNGADDNASGTAAVLELARLLGARPTRRSVLFVNFSGEELGLLGSQYFVEHSPAPVDSIVAMLNFDMVGRMRGDSVIVYGVATAREMPVLLDSANARVGLTVRGLGDGFGPSDHSSFFARSIPVLHFFTNLHEDYHRATDDAHKINAGGTARVVALAERVVREIDRRDQRLSFVRSAAPPAVAGARTGSNVYLGTIPDMAAPDVKGLRLTGVRAGSPADSAGLEAGDIVVELGGREVSDLQTYSDALYSHKPGDEVDIVVVRGGQRVKVRVKLGRRG